MAKPPKKTRAKTKTIDEIFHCALDKITEADLNRKITHEQAGYLLKLSRPRISQLVRDHVILEPLTIQSVIDDAIDYYRERLGQG